MCVACVSVVVALHNRETGYGFVVDVDVLDRD